MTDWLYYILLILATGTGLVAAMLTLPGIWLIVLAAIVYAVVTEFTHLGYVTLIGICLLGIAAEAVEFVAGGAGAKAAGGSNRSIVGALIGGLIGGIIGTFIPLPILGTLIGIVAGTFFGAAALERTKGSSLAKVRAVAEGATKGRILGTILKLPFAIVIAAWVLIAALPLTPRPTPATAPTTTAPSTTAPTTNTYTP
jgi:uncharacterized protein YqgC (DUF456 family)